MESTGSVYKQWIALIGLSLLTFTAFLDFTIINTALPAIQLAFHANVIHLQWIINIYIMILAMFMIAAGKIGDMYGLKKVLYIGSAVFLISTLLCGFATSIGALILMRAFQGLGAAVFFILGVTFISHAFPSNKATKAIVIYGAIAGLGLAIGPFIGGILVQFLNWHWVFFINIPIVVLGLLLILFTLPKITKPHDMPRLDWIGLFMLVTALGALVAGLILGEQNGWPGYAVFCLVVAAVIIPVLFWYEKNIDNPILDFSIFKKKILIIGTLVGVTAGAILYVLMFFDPFYLSAIRNQSAFYVGLTLAAIPVMQVIICFSMHILDRLYGIFRLLIIALISATLACFFHTFFSLGTSVAFIVIAFILLGIAWGIGNAGIVTAANQGAAIEKQGTIIGTIFTFWSLAGTILLTLSVVLFHHFELKSVKLYFLEHHKHLTQHQWSLLRTALASPEKAETILKGIPSHKATIMLDSVKHAFMSGFHAASWLLTGVIFVVLLASLLFYWSVTRSTVELESS